MDPPPPPPPPPHGGRGGLPPGQYDIFVIPPHSAGSGFLYLPSLQPHRNSFLAGVACTLVAVGVWILVVPVLREWFSTIVASGGMGVVILLVSVGVAGWAWGKTQLEKEKPGDGYTGSPPSAGTGAGPGRAGAGPGTGAEGTQGTSSSHTAGGSFGGTAGSGFGSGTNFGGARPSPKASWQRSAPNAAEAGTGTGAAQSGWEKAREETRKKEEDRRKAEELKKKKDDEEKERIKRRETDAQEREAREKRQKEANDRARNEATSSPNRTPSPTKKYQRPTARTAADDDASYSFRPYDKPSRPTHQTAHSTSSYSASSYAPSASTARTSPPPSHARGPYSSKDPDKIVLKAVYSFNHAFTKTPIAKLVSGHGSVTDGLILRITTEGLFIDDDVRGVPQREWDIKAWTMKLVEVWCPCFLPVGARTGSSLPSSTAAPSAGRSSFLGLRSLKDKLPSAEESTLFLASLARTCVQPSPPSLNSSFGRANAFASSIQSGEHKGLHLLRANIRDQEGKRYLFVLQEEEGWKLAVGLQKLRRGTQVRALGVSGMAAGEAKSVLESMGWL